MDSVEPSPVARPVSTYLVAAFGLFLIWSNSFIAASYLLGTEGRPATLDFVSLSVLRFVPIVPLTLIYCFGFKRRESLELLRQYPWRVLGCGLLGSPGYNLALYYGQQNGVPPSVASLTTALVPLFVMLLAAIFLGEHLTGRRIVAFGIALAGLCVITLSKGNLGEVMNYGLILAITALAPLFWSIYSILAKPVMARSSPIVFTYLAMSIGGLPLMFLFPWKGRAEAAELPPDGWMAVLYLSVLCTLLGYAVWTWLLRHLPASTLGFTVFLNPPLTTASKLVLSVLFPAVFLWQLNLLEWLGGGLALLGLAIAVWPRR
jgi:drug/metabolite transporter (DMT)-like permease